MSSIDFIAVLRWWLTLFLLGVAVFPLTARLFPRFLDRGYPFAKVIGLLLLTYSFFILAHLKLVTLTQTTLLLLTLGMFIIVHSISYFLGDKGRLLEMVKSRWLLLSFEEFFFGGALALWSYVRAFAPEIHGLEKFMDFGFVNSILAGKTLPPLDMWLAKAPDYPGHFINYYYFGHLYTAILTRLSGIDSAITYNLSIAVLFAFCAMGAFTLGLNLLHALQIELKLPPKRLIIMGIITAYLMALSGNLHTIYTFYKPYPNESPLPFWQLGANCPTPSTTNTTTNATASNAHCFSLKPALSTFPNSYWYPNATRFIHNTIHEFPIYSFVVSDLHGHVLDIPFVLLTLALLLSMITNSETVKVEDRRLKIGVEDRKSKMDNKVDLLSSIVQLPSSIFHHPSSIFYLIFLGLLLAVMYMTNAWDGLIYMIVSGLVLLYRNWRDSQTVSNEKLPAQWNFLAKTFFQGIILVITFVVFSLPFSLNFKPFVHGLGVVCPPAALSNKPFGPFLFEDAATHCERSPWWMLAILWGFFAYNGLAFITMIIFPKIKPYIKTIIQNTSIFCSLPIVGMPIHEYLHGKKTKTDATGQPLVLSSLASVDVYVFLLTVVSGVLLIFPEFFYVKDIYPLHYRANTMFKLGYQAFMIMSIVSSYVFFRLLYLNRQHSMEKPQKKNAQSSHDHPVGTLPSIRGIGKTLVLLGFFVGFFFVGIYPYFSISSYYGGLRTYKGLDGLAWLRDQYASDYQAIMWLRNQINNGQLRTIPTSNPSADGQLTTYNLQPPPVILEAVGDSYTDYARVSANTGLPTVVGWPVHEWLWRGNYDEAGKRIPLVETMYTSMDENQVKTLLAKYHVSLVFVGALERQKYPHVTEDIFKKIGTVIYEGGETRIYRLL